jgi:hypothetical protein
MKRFILYTQFWIEKTVFKKPLFDKSINFIAIDYIITINSQQKQLK